MAAGLPSWSPSMGRPSPSTPSPRRGRLWTGGSAGTSAHAAMGITPAPKSPPRDRQCSSVGAVARRRGTAAGAHVRRASSAAGQCRSGSKAVASSPSKVAARPIERSSPSRAGKPGASPPWRPSGGQGNSFQPPARRVAAPASGARHRTAEASQRVGAWPDPQFRRPNDLPDDGQEEFSDLFRRGKEDMQVINRQLEAQEDQIQKRDLQIQNRALRALAERLQQELAETEERGRHYRNAAQELLAGCDLACNDGSDVDRSDAEPEEDAILRERNLEFVRQWDNELKKLEHAAL
eukprot:TRINITY_DN105963_c0_g1_i1.p1 TRINITY_DN105963_c0_g1~~TRINITY_DN105963_c0_g1_i1.p1  ORF type:complete len:293 (+),score=46.44 TRINITY_DN105963_c0_g1_i1:23-901(+)